MLKETVKAGNPQLSTPSTIKLKEVGVSRDDSSKWQKIAEWQGCQGVYNKKKEKIIILALRLRLHQ